MLQEPYTMLGINVIAAETDEKAAWLATSLQMQFLNISKGISTQLQPPIENIDSIWSPYERASVRKSLTGVLRLLVVRKLFKGSSKVL